MNAEGENNYNWFPVETVDSNKRTFYDFINNFFKLNDEIITKVDVLEDESDNYNFNNLSQLTLKHLKKFIKKSLFKIFTFKWNTNFWG